MSIDLWDPGVTSTRGYQYILTAVDGFSKFAYVIPIRDKTAKAVAIALQTQVFQGGIPHRLHSDQGAEFVNEVISELCDLFFIDVSKTTAYHPQGNAYAERIHQFFRNATTAYVKRDQRNWDIILSVLTMTYNDTEHSALGRNTPSELYLGRKVNLPLQAPLDEDTIRWSATNYAELLRLALDRTQKVVMEKTLQKLEKNLAKSLGKPTLTYKVGEKVGVSIESIPSSFKSAKLFPRWRGPMPVVRTSRDDKVIYLKDQFDKLIERPISILRIKPWVDRADVDQELGNKVIVTDDDDPVETGDEVLNVPKATNAEVISKKSSSKKVCFQKGETRILKPILDAVRRKMNLVEEPEPQRPKITDATIARRETNQRVTRSSAKASGTILVLGRTYREKFKNQQINEDIFINWQ